MKNKEMPIEYQNMYRLLLDFFLGKRNVKIRITDLTGNWYEWFEKTGITVLGKKNK